MNPLSQILDSQPETVNTKVEWSVRAKHALDELGITSLTQLARMSGRQLESGRNIGATTLREFAAGLVQNHIRPQWIMEIKPQFLDRASSQPDEERFIEIAGPYNPSERWMLELAIAQLNTVEWCVRVDIGLQNQVQHYLYRAKAGFKQTQPEEEI